MEEEDGLSTIFRAIALDSEFDRGGAMDGNDDSSIYSQIGELFKFKPFLFHFWLYI